MFNQKSNLSVPYAHYIAQMEGLSENDESISASINFDHAIIEIAGKDSLAAPLKIIENQSQPEFPREEVITKFLPIAFIHRQCYGNLNEWVENFQYLELMLQAKGIQYYPLVYLDVGELFDFLIIRTMGIVQKYYHYFSPCPACHLLFHMLRIPIARAHDINKIISGERKMHGNRKKLNQLPQILTLLKESMEQENLQLIQPLFEIEDNNVIMALLGEYWAPPDKTCDCSFSKNYYDETGVIPYQTSDVADSLTEFYYPLFSQTVSYICSQKSIPTWDWVSGVIQKILE